ncbi:arylamine N-acetyltransferase [Actinoplanes sp. M2I2]|uniref:arylamine N-acetyltransferase family protein n=1 Tax=Actinoplanes sp. M2I2 TaxID=1734444 RepID=UPI002021B610|nr:arylamine N-acetyltransferase [Actinoplanes sp. M2I2]
MTRAIDIPGYLRRLGIDPAAHGSPSVENLRALHRAHAERVPYECLEIWLGRPTTVDPLESADRILRGRGGYCYHLNGAFSALLRALGYRVGRHVGGVQPTAGRPAGATGNHLVLTVSELPAPGAPHGRWLVDLGMGDGLHEPLPLVEGEYRQGPFRYALRPSTAEPGGWRFDHDPRGGFLGLDFRGEATGMPAFADQHRHLSTSPESGFVRTATVQRRDATGADVLRGLTLTRVGETTSSTVLDDRQDYFNALDDLFGLPLDDVTPPERADLWRRLVIAHEQWINVNRGST